MPQLRRRKMAIPNVGKVGAEDQSRTPAQNLARKMSSGGRPVATSAPQSTLPREGVLPGLRKRGKKR